MILLLYIRTLKIYILVRHVPLCTGVHRILTKNLGKILTFF